MADGGGPIQTSPASITAWAKRGVLGEEAVAGVDRVGAAALCAASMIFSIER